MLRGREEGSGAHTHKTMYMYVRAGATFKHTRVARRHEPAKHNDTQLGSRAKTTREKRATRIRRR